MVYTIFKMLKQAINIFDEGYSLVGDYVPVDWDEDIIPVRDGPSLLNEKVHIKYYNELTMLDGMKLTHILSTSLDVQYSYSN